MKTRLISAFIALIIIVPFILIGGYPFAFAISVLGILSYKEILDLKKSHQEIPILVKIFGLLSLIYFMIGSYKPDNFEFKIEISKMIIPLLLMLIPTLFYKNDKYTTRDAFYLLGVIYLFGTIFNLVMIIRNIDFHLFLYLLSISIFTDTFAYLIGMLIGKHKMAPVISPKKSWEGAIAGTIGGSSVALIVYSNLISSLDLKIVFITIILSITGQIGDLVYSKIKRENGIKDFSNIMPGHGGILDRIDSVTFVIIAYVLIISFL